MMMINLILMIYNEILKNLIIFIKFGKFNIYGNKI